MRVHQVALAFACAILFAGSFSTAAQTNQPPKPSAAATSNQAHDLSGVWFDDRPRPITTNERYWIYKFNAEEPPMTAWGQAQYDSTKSSFGTHAFPLAETNDPLYHTCTPPGLPRIYLHPFPMQIVQTTDEVIVLFEYDSIRHQIHTDGRAHDTSLGPLWMGDSIGHWEGDTLVADTVNFNDKTWLDRIGHPHSDALHVVERFRRKDHEHLELEITIEDVKAYTKRWTTHIEFGLRPKWTLAEQFCEDEESFQTLDKNAATSAK
jgi:hypothetical protein